MKIHLNFSFFLPSITDGKESINQWLGHANLVPIDLTIDFIESYLSKKEKFKPHLLNSTDPKERAPQVEILLNVFKHMAQYSNQNLSRNVDYLFVKKIEKVRVWSGVLVRQNDPKRVCFYISMITFG